MRYEIHFKGWTSSGWSYDSTYEQGETNDYDWSITDFIDWYFEDFDEDGFKLIEEREKRGEDCYISYIVYDDNNNEVYNIGFWENAKATKYKEA